MKKDAQALIAAIRARGSDVFDLRDAAHEAHHALSAKVRGKWTRERIHSAVIRLGRSYELADEVMARAVESLVCAHFGIETWPTEKQALTSSMEAIKYGRPCMPRLEMMIIAIDNAKRSEVAKEAAARVIALAEPTAITGTETAS